MPTHDKPSRNRGELTSRTRSTGSNGSNGRSGGTGRTRSSGGGSGSGNGSPRNRSRNPDLVRTKRKWSWKKTWWALFFATALAIFAAVGGYLFILLNGERLMKEYQAADMFELAQASTVLDRHGNQIAKLGTNESKREIVEENEVPKLLEDAFVATEDQRFWDHSGVDLWSIGRAMVRDIMAGGFVEGGSTITQQLAKNMFLTSDKTLFRKATEVSIALALENHYTKDQILTMYLNQIYFGKGAYGVKAASITYFGKSNLEDLELWEIATLAAIPKAPSHYNPINNPEKSKERRAVVLQLMHDQGYISQTEMEQAKAVDYEPVATQTDENGGTKNDSAPYQAFLDYMVQEAEEMTGLTEDQLYRGGYQITTTVDSNAQQVMYEQFNKDSNFEESKDDIKSQSAMVITDHSNGAIMAMMGGRDYERKGLNRATVKRQPGSSFKPIITYAPAIETGQWYPWSTLRDDKQCFGDYCPTDYGRNKYVGPIDMTTALKRSTNMPAVWLLNEIGLKTGYEFAKNLGIEFDDTDYNLSLALGGMSRGTTPIEMAEAYNTFANGGKFYPAYTIKQIVDKKGNVVYKYKQPEPKQVMSEQTAYYMTQMMQEVVNSGTGTKAQMDRPVAGKTGSTQHGIPGYEGTGARDLWFVGYTPEWTASVWMGYDKTDPDHLMTGSSGQPAELFSTIMSQALRGIDEKEFPKPSGVKEEVKPKPNPAVTGLQGSYSENTKHISLSWNPVEGEDVHYNLYRKSSTETMYTKIFADMQGTTVEDIGVQPGETYTYYITASSKDTPEESPKSNEVVIAIPTELEPEVPVKPIDPPVTEPDDPNVPEVPDNGGVPGDNTGDGDVSNPDGGTDTGVTQPGGGNGQDNNSDMPADTQPDGGNNGKGNGHGNGNGKGNKLDPAA
ncbi:PBP1A family penicillin-binding protein [Paenibacillus marinisediminis]